ncbi:MAG TPA: carboxypeptidase-like regulatory domain-containing protein, partial [Longimicrobiaceae bacterium]|nr:carboxypeptidase-like regulatory domain-containing protein [Longimicrobiaceae bacterium]
MRRALLPVALLLLAGAAPALAQTVRGRLSGAGGEAVPGARVVLVSVDGRTVAATTTDAGGGFSLAAREAGLYRLRAERVGYAATWSAPFSLEAGQAVQHPLVANPQRVQLEGIRVEARARCEVRPAEGARTALVWEEARKALELASAATRAGLYRFDATRFERALDPYSLTVTREEVTTRADYAGTPYAAASVERLAEHGFVEKGRDRMVFYAPDADVLLSDAFLDTHCFRLAEHPDRASGLIGLTFEPVPGRRVPDVEGVVWVDRATAELRSLDYRYTDLELREGDNLAAGRVEFLRLPSGSWIVSRWAIRMPVVESGSLAPGWRSLSDARRLTAIG